MTNPWRQEGFFYVARLELTRICTDGRYRAAHMERKLDFVSYHLIKWIHGEQKLIDMVYNTSFLE
jgi:hypothetical protein